MAEEETTATATSAEETPATESPAETQVETGGGGEDWRGRYEDLDARYARLEAQVQADRQERETAAQRVYQERLAVEQDANDPKPDPWEQPEEYAEWRERRAEARFVARLATAENQDFNRRCVAGEEWLEDKNLLDEYRSLVNLQDPGNAVKQYLDRNPDAWQEIRSAANPPKRVYQLAKDLELRSPQSFDARVQAEVDKRLQASVEAAVAKALGKRQPARMSDFRPGVSNLPSSPGSTTAKEPREMSDDELKTALKEARSRMRESA